MEQIERLVQPPSSAETLAPSVDRHGRAQMAAMLEYIAWLLGKTDGPEPLSPELNDEDRLQARQSMAQQLLDEM